MSYSTTKLLTVADCDQAISIANTRKSDLLFEQTVLSRESTGKEKNATLNAAKLATVKAEITGAEAAIAAVPDGDYKTTLQSKLRRLNDRKDNLEDQLSKSGAVLLLDAELDVQLLSLQVAEVEAYLTAVEDQKAAL